MSKATIKDPFLSCHVQGLSKETISTIRTAYQPDFTDGDDDINDLFHLEALLEMFFQLEKDPTDHPSGLSPEQYRAATDELEAISGLDKYRYISIESAD